MILTQTTEYALRTLALMSQDAHAIWSSTVLHRRLGIPRKYLQRVLTDLVRSGLLRSTRGRAGGYALARSTTRITLAQVIDAVEGLAATPSCFFGFGTCPMDNPCAMHEVWTRHQKDIFRTLATTRLADLVARRP